VNVADQVPEPVARANLPVETPENTFHVPLALKVPPVASPSKSKVAPDGVTKFRRREFSPSGKQ
jgi:hypothetical protein